MRVTANKSKMNTYGGIKKTAVFVVKLFWHGFCGRIHL
jgi:hypothetical protein